MNLTNEERKKVEAYKKYYRTLMNLRETREKSGFSLDDLAQMSGVPKATISKIETGKRNVTIDTLITLAAAMNKNIEIQLV